MKRSQIVALAVSFYGCLTVLAGDFVEVPNGTSPGGLYAARIMEPSKGFEDGWGGYLVLHTRKTGEIFARFPIKSYARYPKTADPINTQILWSPDSKHFALMIRDTKRSWRTTIFGVSTKGVYEVNLPDPTTKALALLSVSTINRILKERPTRWIDNDLLLLRASGDTIIDRKVVWYDVDITYSMQSGKIVNTEVIATKPYAG